MSNKSPFQPLVRASIIAAAVILAACGAATPIAPTAAPAATAKPAATTAPAAPAASGTVSWMVSGDNVEFDAYKRIAAAFEAANPAIKVDLVYIPASGDYRNRLDADIAAGSPSDLVFMNYQRYAVFAAKNQLTPVGDYLATQNLPPRFVLAPHPDLAGLPWADRPMLEFEARRAQGVGEALGQAR